MIDVEPHLRSITMVPRGLCRQLPSTHPIEVHDGGRSGHRPPARRRASSKAVVGLSRRTSRGWRPARREC